MPVPKDRCRLGLRARSSVSGCGLASGSILAAANMAMIRSPFLSQTPPSSMSLHKARFGELHRRDEAQELLNRQRRAAPVLLEPIAQFGSSCQLIDCSADQMRGGF